MRAIDACCSCAPEALRARHDRRRSHNGHTLARDHPAPPYAGRVASQLSRSRAASLPVGTLTFLFTDIEGSTRLVAALGPAFGPLIERHHAVLRAAIEAAGGIEVSTEGDAFFVVFQSAMAAVTATVAAQRSLAAEPWPPGVGAIRVRMGLHTGEGILGGDDYVGLDVHRAARIAAAAHGGQILVSAATATVVRGSLPGDLRLRELGEFRLKDLDTPERLAQLCRARPGRRLPAAAHAGDPVQPASRGDELRRPRTRGRRGLRPGAAIAARDADGPRRVRQDTAQPSRG